MQKQIDATLCPLCHQNNGCMMHTSERCWCADITVPQGLIDLVPQKLKRQACICRSCIEKYNKNPEDFVVIK